MIILQKHYTHTINELTHTPQPTNIPALKIATNWAHKRCGHRLTPTSMHTLRAHTKHTLYLPRTTPNHNPPSSPDPPTLTSNTTHLVLNQSCSFQWSKPTYHKARTSMKLQDVQTNLPQGQDQHEAAGYPNQTTTRPGPA